MQPFRATGAKWRPATQIQHAEKAIQMRCFQFHPAASYLSSQPPQKHTQDSSFPKMGEQNLLGWRAADPTSWHEFLRKSAGKIGSSSWSRKHDTQTSFISHNSRQFGGCGFRKWMGCYIEWLKHQNTNRVTLLAVLHKILLFWLPIFYTDSVFPWVFVLLCVFSLSVFIQLWKH